MRLLYGLASVFLLVVGCAEASPGEKAATSPSVNLPATIAVADTEAPAQPSLTPAPPQDASSPATDANASEPALPIALVSRVIDGDTVELGDGSRVRYIGMNTPESAGDCYNREATERNIALVLNRVVQLEKDVSETDRFGRLLRYVYVDGVMVNELLVLDGYAKVATYPPDVKYQDRLLAAQQQAVAAGAGLWSGCQGTAPAPQPAQRGNCHPSYPTVCIPPPPPDLDCGQVPYRRFQVVGADPHRFDADRDGVGCESG
jgi:micrococcal nuclease